MALGLTTDEWQAETLGWIGVFAAAGIQFSADDLRNKVPEPHHPSAWGAVFRAACNTGLITACGFRESSTPSRKGGVVRIWQKAGGHEEAS